jgi:benzil reductase ((S)-benzoin forming)
MTSHLYIITGASRGMGLAMAAQLLQPGHQLLCISRKTNDALAAQAASAGVHCEQWAMDLAHADEAAMRLETWLLGQATPQVSVNLINNAAVLPAIAPLSDLSAADIATALRVGLEAPMLLTAAFLRATAPWLLMKRVLNISSGNGRRPMAAQATYSAAKAGMDHFTRCVALEEAAKPRGARVCSLAPGVVDTDMQAHLRAADDATFSSKPIFMKYHAEDLLTSPPDAAARVLAYLNRSDFGSEPVADVRDV